MSPVGSWQLVPVAVPVTEDPRSANRRIGTVGSLQLAVGSWQSVNAGIPGSSAIQTPDLQISDPHLSLYVFGNGILMDHDEYRLGPYVAL